MSFSYILVDKKVLFFLRKNRETLILEELCILNKLRVRNFNKNFLAFVYTYLIFYSSMLPLRV